MQQGAPQQQGGAAPPDPIALLAATMPALLPEWNTILTNLGMAHINMRTLARAQGITDLETMSIYAREDVHHIFKQLRMQTVVPQIIEVRTLALARWAAKQVATGQNMDPALVTVALLTSEA
jgi:hypothetical protein